MSLDLPREDFLIQRAFVFKYEIAQFTTVALLERLRSIVFNKLYTDSSEGRLWIHELHNSQQ